MKKYDFDEIIDRAGTDCVKYDGLEKAFGVSDALPLWVADMDFKTPDFIMEAIKKRCEHEILGYTFPSASYYKAIVEWVRKRHNWAIAPEQITFLSGIVPALGHCLNALTEKGDKVLVQPPVYMPFHWIPQNLSRTLVYNHLVESNGRYVMNYDELDRLMGEGCKVMILCNPHNPGGRVWSREELLEVAGLSQKHGVLVISDEIHGDLTLNGKCQIPYASVSDYAAGHSITLMAPSKTFNLAGLATSYSVIPDEALRRCFKQYIDQTELANGTIFSFVAAQAAYEHGEEWLNECTGYVWENMLLAQRFFQTHLPAIRPMMSEASYLLWLDCRALNLPQNKLVHFFLREAHVALNDGAAFGPGGEGYMRMNLACPRSRVEQALCQMAAAYRRLYGNK